MSRKNAVTAPVTAPRKPHRPKRTLESGDVDIGAAQQGVVKINLEGPAVLDRPEVQVIDGPEALAFAEQMAFMNESVTVVLLESADPQAEDPVAIKVNDRLAVLHRGVPTIVKRFIVERMARAKLTTYRQDLAQTDPDQYNRLFMKNSVMYPFSVVEDRNPRGRDWLMKVLREA